MWRTFNTNLNWRRTLLLIQHVWRERHFQRHQVSFYNHLPIFSSSQFIFISQMKYYDSKITKKANWDPDWGYPGFLSDADYPKRTILNGAKNALVVVLLTRKDEIDHACRDFSLQGMRVSVNNLQCNKFSCLISQYFTF